jgi:hypothetical protein
MKNNILLTLVLVISSTFFFTHAHAACQWEWVCNENGRCRNIPVCDSTLDIVPPQSPSIPPIAPPSIRPIQPPTLLPLGTSRCTQVQKRDAFGNWHWETVCD